MSSYTNDRGQIVYADNEEDVGIARPQGDGAAAAPTKTNTSSTSSHEKDHGTMHNIKETVKYGVQSVADGMGKLADKITNNPEHDHLSPKIEVIKQ
uniref:Uncharacterized protein n=1 Tax=Panagrolaimus superbus TaxID=310955 RepID=A0A914YF18_9BILA